MKNKVIDLFENTNSNNGIKYSVLLSDFMNPFENDFPDYFDIEEIFDFSIHVWNIGNIAQNVSSEDLEKLFFPPEMQKELLRIHKKMLKLKLDKFNKYNRFIIDFSIEEDKKLGLKLVVVTGDEKAYSDFLKGKFIDEMEENNFEDNYIDRNAIVLILKQPFIDWVNKLHPDDVETINDNKSNVYLVNDDNNDVEKWLKRNYTTFFEMELEDWCTDKKEWPKKRSYKLFKEWFTVSVSTLVYDLEKYPVRKD